MPEVLERSAEAPTYLTEKWPMSPRTSDLADSAQQIFWHVERSAWQIPIEMAQRLQSLGSELEPGVSWLPIPRVMQVANAVLLHAYRFGRAPEAMFQSHEGGLSIYFSEQEKLGLIRLYNSGEIVVGWWDEDNDPCLVDSTVNLLVFHFDEMHRYLRSGPAAQS